jgi:hypothetical protein
MDSRDMLTAQQFQQAFKVLEAFGPDALDLDDDAYTWDSKAREVRHGS